MLGLGQLSFDLAPIRRGKAQTRTGVSIVAKRKKASKVQKRGKLPKGTSARLRKARKVAPAKRTVAKANAPVKKAARRMKQPVTPAVEDVAVEVIEQPCPYRKLNSNVLMVQSSEERLGNDAANCLDRPRNRCILAQ